MPKKGVVIRGWDASTGRGEIGAVKTEIPVTSVHQKGGLFLAPVRLISQSPDGTMATVEVVGLPGGVLTGPGLFQVSFSDVVQLDD